MKWLLLLTLTSMAQADTTFVVSRDSVTTQAWVADSMVDSVTAGLPLIWSASHARLGDLNMDGRVVTSDIIYLVNYVLKGGAPPVADTVHHLRLYVSPDKVVFTRKAP